MAQTIQIRRGTGSAVPSSLAAGELAINTETGKFYYGNGSAVSSDFRVDSITAESYTVSSSVTSYTFQALSGSTDFGDDIGDIHNRTGSVNVSGSMSIATDLSVAGNLSVALGDGASNHIKLGNSTLGTTGGFLISGSSLGNPLITLKQSAQTATYGAPGIKFQRIANSDGSAIGLITYSSPDSAGNETTYVRISGNIEENQSGQEGGKYTVEVASHDGELQPGLTIEDGDAEDEVDVTIGNTTTSLTTIAGNLSIGNSITSNITASGNISSSGDINSSRYLANEQLALNNVNGAITLGYDNTYPINIGKSTNPIKLFGNVTSSGNISSSGTITGDSMTVETDGQAQMLISTTNAFTNRDVGLTLSASSNGQQYTLGLNRPSNTFIIAPSDVNSAPENAVFELDAIGNITASGNISSSDYIYADRYYSNGQIALNNINGAITVGYDNSYPIIIGKLANPITLVGQVTASGNISSSGEIKANTLDVASTSNFVDDITIGDTKKIIGTRLIISSSNNTGFYGDISVTDGDLSLNAAGAVLDVHGQGDATDASGDTGAIRTEGGISIAKKAFIGTQLSVGSHITASGNISSSGTVTANTFVGDITGDLTGNAATATALTAGSKNIDGDLSLGANQAGHSLNLFGATTNLASLVWKADSDFLKFSDGAKIVFGTGVASADFDSSIQADGSNLVIYNDTGNVQIGDTVEITGDLSVSAAATASTGSFDVMTKALNIIPFAYFVSSVHTSELYIPVAGSLSESNFDQYYHMFHAPYNGVVKRIALSWQSGTPGDSTIRVRKASNFDLDDSGDIVETVVISSAAQDTMYYADFSASFSKGDVVAFTVQQSGTDNSYIGGTIAMEFDTSS